MKVLAIIQARMSSTRLPGKVLKDIGGKPLIKLLFNRLSRAKYLDNIIVACTENEKDEKLARYLEKENITYFRGDELNVLKRFYDCASIYRPEYVMRITADCPFISSSLIDACLRKIIKNNYDYVSNTEVRSYPDGLDVAVFSFALLEEAYNKCTELYDLEHVTPYMKKNDSIKRFNIKNEIDFSDIRITVDEERDLHVMRNIYAQFGNDFFSWRDIVNLKKDRPEIFEKNKSIKRNEGSVMTNTSKLWKRAKAIIPGGNHLLSKRPEQFAPEFWPAYYKKAKGIDIWDLENNRYKDLSIMGVGTNILGYANDEVDDEVVKNIKKGNMSTLNCSEEVHLAERLLDINRWADMVRLARTGGEANAIAIRIARAATSKSKVAICGYHGWHDWYLSANLMSDDSLGGHHLDGFYTSGVPKELEGTTIPFKYNNFEELKNIVSDHDIGTIKMEVMRNEEPKDDFLRKVRNLATEKNIVLIFDECTSGFRETFGGLHIKYEVQPDIAMYGKAMGNGYAITAVVGKEEIMNSCQDTFISSTFWTERAGPVAALKTLDIMERDKSWEYICTQGEYISKCWREIADKNNLKIKIFGLPCITKYNLKTNNEFLKYKTFITQEMLKKGFLATNSVYVSMLHDKNIIDEYIENLDHIFSLIQKCENEELSIDDLLEGDLCHNKFTRLN